MIKNKIRFLNSMTDTGYTTLGEVSHKYRISNKTVHNKNLLSLSYGKIVNKDIESTKGLRPSSFDTYQLIKEQIIVVRVTDLQNDKKSLRVGLSTQTGIISPAYVCIECDESKILPEYLYVVLHYHDIVTKKFYQMGDGMRQTLTFDDLKNLEIVTLPFNVQKAFVSYFKSLDDFIQGSMQKIMSLKQLKQASLVSMFPQQGETKPRVRFKGFTEEWKVIKLSEISKKVTKKNSNMVYDITLTNSAEHGIINQLDYFDHEVSNRNNIKGYYVVENDDFVYNPRISDSAPVGPINRNMLGYTGVMSPLYYVFKVYGIDKNYLSWYFKTSLWHSFLKDNGNSGARFDRLSISDGIFSQMPILKPTNDEEQRQIAQFFATLDNQISLETQRLEKLKQIKSACLDKMFV